MERINFGIRVGTTIYNTGIVVRALSSQTFAEKGFELTPEQFLILDLVQEYGELYQRQMCEITQKDRSNVARLVKILEDKGLITRKQSCFNGRRIYKISVTEAGKAVRNEMKPMTQELRKTLIEGISNEELEIMLTTLNKVYDNARQSVKLQI